jgi:hypothetical protein
LSALGKNGIKDALDEALGRVDPAILKAQLLQFVPPDAQQILARAGIRDEHVFPTPIIIETAPTLIGYYRLLLGVPQKTFYGTGTGMGPLKPMEASGGEISARQQALLEPFCIVMIEALTELVRGLSPSVTSRDVNELPLLTLGSFFQGGNNNIIGKQVTLDVFQAITVAIEPHIMKRDAKRLVVSNLSKDKFLITLAGDPDVRIEENASEKIMKRVAIEIKGGTDKSNAHNRAGEAEKSHLKAKKEGFEKFWTLIHKKGMEMIKIESESPTTTVWFDVAHIIARQGDDWMAFKRHIAKVIRVK